MKRFLITGFVTLMLAGCAEMKIITDAAINELRVDAINVEQAAYRARYDKVTTIPVQTAAVSKDWSKKIIAKGQGERKKLQKEIKKGLWESKKNHEPDNESIL